MIGALRLRQRFPRLGLILDSDVRRIRSSSHVKEMAGSQILGGDLDVGGADGRLGVAIAFASTIQIGTLRADARIRSAVAFVMRMNASNADRDAFAGADMG